MNPFQGGGGIVFAVPPWMHERPREPDRAENVPRRVQVALGLIHWHGDQMQPRIAANDVSIEEVKPRVPELEEKEAVLVACKLVTEYLKGNYKPTKAEETELRNRGKEDKRTMMRCPQCGGSSNISNQECDLCDGYGFIRVSPANPQGVE